MLLRLLMLFCSRNSATAISVDACYCDDLLGSSLLLQRAVFAVAVFGQHLGQGRIGLDPIFLGSGLFIVPARDGDC